MLPLQVQARKAIWQAVNPHTGRRRIDEAFPHALRASTNETDMRISFKNGSAWRVVGSDNPDSLVGTAPAGLVFSEFALTNPAAWGYLAPILEENGGWSMMISTPRGRNHCHSTYKMAESHPKWGAFFSSVVESGFPLDRVEEARVEYAGIFGDAQADALIQQEYFCSFDSAILGAFWGHDLAKAFKEGRTGMRFGVEPGFPIHRAWDLGIGDPMAIFLYQCIGRDIRILDYYENQGLGFDHYAEFIRRKRNIRGGIDYVPHDAKVRELAGGGKTRVESMIAEGLTPELVPLYKMEDGINAARRILGRCYFHERAERGVEMLRHYRSKWDDDRRVFLNKEEHDFSSHASSAFKTLAMAYEEVAVSGPQDRPRSLIIAPEPGMLIPGQLTMEDAWNLPDGEFGNPLGYQ